MSIADGLIGELKISDILTFLTVQRCGTISSAARELVVTPSQVSKTITRIEELLGTPLLARSANGVALLEEGRNLIPQFEQMLELARSLRVQPDNTRRPLGIAAPSYLAAYFTPLIAAELPGVRLRVLEKPPAQIRALMASGHFDVALGLGGLPQGSAWDSHVAGDTEKALFCSPAAAARLGGTTITREAVANQPIISPLYLTDTGLLPVDDDGPVARTERTVGHETMTFGLGLALAARTDQLVFGPVIGAIPFLEDGTLVKLTVEGWSRRDSVRVAYNTERITSAQQRAIVSAVERGLAAIKY